MILKTYIVTGGAGFLGSHLCERLIKNDENCRVVAIDNLSSSDGSNLKKLQSFHPTVRFDFINRDVTNKGLWHDLRGWEDIVGVFNLACPASPPFYQSKPIETMLTSVLGAHHALEFATYHKCKILQTSTSEVYGDPEVSPQSESYRGSVNCFGPRSCYDEGKRAAESLFYDYHKKYKTDIRVVRIFNTYGPHMLADDGRVVSNFINQAIDDKPITLYGDGTQSRSFCYVDDLIDAMMIVWNSDYTIPVNIGNPDERSILDLAENIIRITGSKSELEFKELPKDDPLQRCPDISLIKSIGWDGPQISLDKGLRNTIQYFLRKNKFTPQE